MSNYFSADYSEILNKIDAIDPIKYGHSRNYIDGAVTYLSPYISRGVISTKQVLSTVLAKGHKLEQIESFVKELCWRDYFQRVAQNKNPNTSIRQEQISFSNKGISIQVLKAETEIIGIDNAIKELYNTGYMHNHCRMYTAFLVCNVAKSHWHHPAQWMYYHLLDGDWASNACSWQWVAGANSSKLYLANQENINKYSKTNQAKTFLAIPYEQIAVMETPKILLQYQQFEFEFQLPQPTTVKVDKQLPTFIYNYYNLDPLWHKDEKGNRILLLDPSIFKLYPVSKKCIDFMLELSKNIEDIQVYVGSFHELVGEFKLDKVFFKEHPFNFDYKGTEESRDWIAPDVSGYYPSFFNYWKKVQKVWNLK